ncbi:MAG: PTS IIA-like nitrogen regulatory protein PtsN [Pseudomonadota bacterium]
MTISALLSPERVFPDTEISSKKKLLELVATTVSDQTGLPQSALFNNLLDRERLGSTGLGKGFAVPHARLKSLDQALGYFYRLNTPINFEAQDNQPVDLVFTIIVPEEATEEHLIILSSLAGIFSKPEVCDAIRKAPSSADILQIIELAEQ